jgi:hypothetical protein
MYRFLKIKYRYMSTYTCHSLLYLPLSYITLVEKYGTYTAKLRLKIRLSVIIDPEIRLSDKETCNKKHDIFNTECRGGSLRF